MNRESCIGTSVQLKSRSQPTGLEERNVVVYENLIKVRRRERYKKRGETYIVHCLVVVPQSQLPFDRSGPAPYIISLFFILNIFGCSYLRIS